MANLLKGNYKTPLSVFGRVAANWASLKIFLLMLQLRQNLESSKSVYCKKNSTKELHFNAFAFLFLYPQLSRKTC